MANAALAATPWSQIQGSATHTGQWNGKFAPAGIQSLWSKSLGLNNSTQVAVSSDGTQLFAAAKTADGAQLYGLNASNGSVLWSATVNARNDLWSSSSPIYDNGYVYWAGSKYDTETETGGTGNFNIYQFNANTGEMLNNWSKTNYTGEINNNSPTVANGKLYISTYGAIGDNYYTYAAHHYSIDLANGDVTWSNGDGGQGQGCLGYDPQDGLIFQSILDGTAHKVRAYYAGTGQTAWTTSWASTYALQENAIAYDAGTNAIYLQDYKFAFSGSNASKLYKISATTGEIIWEADTASAGSSPVVVGPDGSVYVTGDYRGSGQTFKYDATGQLVATTTICGGWSSAPAWADGFLFTGDQNWSSNNFYILDDALTDSNGNPLVVKTLTGSGPASFGLDAFYTIGKDGVLYAYELPCPGDATHDRNVDVSDLGILAANYGSSSANWNKGDFNGDGKVDVSDLGILAANYGYNGVLPTPEPISITLIGLGGLIISRRKF